MANTKKISQPSQGSEDLGTETRDKRNTGTPSAGTDTQLHLAAKSGHKNKNKSTNDDEKVVRNSKGQGKFLKPDETDE
ncbi:MAG: hypothetical protein ABI419_01115 [Ginsengibacter sp.]